MQALNKVFNIEIARSKSIDDHEEGHVAFVSNGFENNGVVGFVTPLNGEKTFDSVGICVSAFCEATVQYPPFLPRGNGGSGLVILLPKKAMPEDELYYYAALINSQNWRFSFGRMVTKDRISTLEIPSMKNKFLLPVRVSKLLPAQSKSRSKNKALFRSLPLSRFFNIVKGKGEYLEDCKDGNTPLISATGKNNGIGGLVNLRPIFKAPSITVERVSGNAFVQNEDFVTAPDDIFVLSPKTPLSLEILFYVAAMLNLQRWRFNYSRKFTPTRFNKLTIPIPLKDDDCINVNYIKGAVRSSYGWSTIGKAY